ncbi:hypothetical protein EUTSA_v10009788mg [Eutrema salsugineum]|uniref:Uncharacterized protein n=1 Tax=Eutrema salsugineum TaxID=72664 RepID=V4MQN1_EUTSA|nr:hypothetical protein EUTSA_v10009788mg [Eutrema salsugineum]
MELSISPISLSSRSSSLCFTAQFADGDEDSCSSMSSFINSVQNVHRINLYEVDMLALSGNADHLFDEITGPDFLAHSYVKEST